MDNTIKKGTIRKKQRFTDEEKTKAMVSLFR
jgi:hypothetical protein